MHADAAPQMNMICAIYARKSTEQTSVADEQKSVTRQIEHARAYAASKGWAVDDRFVFVDDGISGAEFTNRPGFVRLMNALKPRAAFEVLVVSELSRLGREQLETGYAVKQLSQAGVKIFSYLEGGEILLDTPTDKFLMSAVNFAAEIAREQGRQRTYDAMIRKARAGHVTGGRVFGYDNVRSVVGVQRVINEAEAAVVQRIFRLAASKYGFTRIAKQLNDDRALSPRSQQGRPSGWAASSVREVLFRPLYRGEIVWNRTRKRDRWGAKHQSGRPESEWVRVTAPELGIVADHLWKSAHRQMTRQRQRYSRIGVQATPWTNESRYLLTGLLRCGVCGCGLEVRSRNHGRQRFYFYGCSGYHRRGSTVCQNALIAPMEAANEAVLTSLETGFLNPGAIITALCQTSVSDAHEAQAVAPIRQSMNEQSERVGLWERLEDCRRVLRRAVPTARPLLKQLIVGRIQMQPDPKLGVYRFRGSATLEPLVSDFAVDPRMLPLPIIDLAGTVAT